MPEHDQLDRQIRAANFIPQDAPTPPVAELLARLDHDPLPARRPRLRGRTTILAVGIALAVSGTATATVVALRDTGPSTGLDAAATPESAASKRLTGVFAPKRGSKLTDERRAFPELGDAGTVGGITVAKDEFEVDVAQDGGKVCFGAHLPGKPVTTGGCTNLPIPYDAIPLNSGGTLDPPRQIYYSVAPDGVRNLTVITKDGQRKTEPFVDNIAAITFDGEADMANYTWTLPNGDVAQYRP